MKLVIALFTFVICLSASAQDTSVIINNSDLERASQDLQSFAKQQQSANALYAISIITTGASLAFLDEVSLARILWGISGVTGAIGFIADRSAYQHINSASYHLSKASSQKVKISTHFDNTDTSRLSQIRVARDSFNYRPLARDSVLESIITQVAIKYVTMQQDCQQKNLKATFCFSMEQFHKDLTTNLNKARLKAESKESILRSVMSLEKEVKAYGNNSFFDDTQKRTLINLEEQILSFKDWLSNA